MANGTPRPMPTPMAVLSAPSSSLEEDASVDVTEGEEDVVDGLDVLLVAGIRLDVVLDDVPAA